MFGLAARIVVCLQSSYTGDDVYILEFLLPPDCREDGEQKELLESISVMMKQNLRSLNAFLMETSALLSSVTGL